MAFAHTERGGRYSLAHVRTRATRKADAWSIAGEKCIVLHAPCAELLVVSARTGPDGTEHLSSPTGISVFLVPVNAKGVRRSLSSIVQILARARA